MIYQMTIYYGAMLNNEVIYSMESTLENCTKFPKRLSSEHYCKVITNLIEQDGFNPHDFDIGYLTKEQYENRYEKDNEIQTIYNIERS